MNINFEGKIALVTGAGRGIGKEIAKQLANGGAKVYALAKNQSNLDDLKAQFNNVTTIAVDLSDWDATRKAVSEIGSIDLLVNNAAVMGKCSFEDVTEKEFDRIYSVNCKAVINVSQIIVKEMKLSGKGGAIVNVSSIASLRGAANQSIYGSSKSSLDLLTKTMAIELGPHNIRVNCVNPQVVETDMTTELRKNDVFVAQRLAATPLGRFCRIDDIAHAVLFLLSEKASMITGVILPVDGGYMAGPTSK